MVISLLLVCATSVACDDAPAHALRRPVVMRVHSLAGLVDSYGMEQVTLGLLPTPIGGGNKTEMGTETSGPTGAAFMSPEDLVGLLRDTIDSELWEDGSAHLDLVEQSRLLVVAPAETQDRIADFLGRFAASLCPTTTLSVAVLSGTNGGDGGIYADTAAADKLDAQLGVVRRAQLSLLGRGIVSAEDLTTGSAVFDWDVEIAQGAIISDPIVVATHAGLELAARAVPAEAGMYVALVLREAETAAEPVTRVAEGNGLLVAQQLLADRPAAGLLQHPRFGFVSYAGTCFLPAGKALLLPVTVQTHVGPVSFTLDLRLGGALPPARARFDAKLGGEGEPRFLAFASRGLSGLSNVAMEGLPARLFDERWSTLIDSPCWRASLDTGDDGGDRMVELARGVAASALDDGRGQVVDGGAWVRMQLPANLIEDVGNAMATLDQHVCGELDGRITDGDTVVATFKIPYVEGRALALWSGVQGARVSDWDVDVANEAQIPNPTVESWVDGFALKLRVTRDARGHPLVRANGVLHLLDGEPQKVDLRDQSRLSIEQVRARHVAFDELRALPDKGGKVRFGGDALGLEIDVKSR